MFNINNYDNDYYMSSTFDCLQNMNKLTKEGYLVMRSEKTRSQQLNLADALHRLRLLIWKATEPEQKPSEETIERLRRR